MSPPYYLKFSLGYYYWEPATQVYKTCRSSSGSSWDFSWFILFLEALSDRVAVSNASDSFLLRLLHIILGAVRVGAVLGVWNNISLTKSEQSFFTLWGFIELFPCLLGNSPAGGRLVVIGSIWILELVSRSFLGILPAHLFVLYCVQILVELIIGHQTILSIFKLKFVLHGTMQYIVDGLSYYLLSQTVFALVPVRL